MKYISILLTVIFIFCSKTQAQYISPNAGRTSNLFLRTDLSVRASGMSSAFTGLADDENAVFFNPAGLAMLKRGALALNHTKWFEDISMDNLAFAYNFDRKFGVAFSLSHMWMPQIQGKNYLGQETEMLSVSSSIAALNMAYKFLPSFYGGVGIKYFQDNLADYKASGLALDAGIYMHTLIRGLSLGMAVQNFGNEIRYDVQSQSLPLTFRTGFAYRLMQNRMILAMDAVKRKDNDIAFNVGVEFHASPLFTLRVGNSIINKEKFFSPSVGFGMNLQEQYIINYAFYQHSDLGATHRIGFAFHFKLPSKYKQAYSDMSIPVSKLMPPHEIQINDHGDFILVKWTRITGANYNIYVRSAKNQVWKKLNRHPLFANQKKIKKPKKGMYYICVTSVINNQESNYSKEAVINVEK